jgi:CheY-like chemotaxis protein
MPVAARNISVTSDLYPEPLVVRASEAHIVRALGNLVRNATEAIERDGRIVIQTRRVVVTEPVERYETIEPGDYAVVAVSDTGHGIPASELGRVFEPFFTRKRLTDCNGSGLGLAIIHSVTKEHDGFVDVESVVGVGSTFTLYFPRVVRAVERPSLTSHAPRQCLRVLVVDDEPTQLRTARRVLSRYGYEVDTAGTGEQAYGFFVRAANSEGAANAADEPSRSPFDVVVMDVMLNESEDGFALFERIRQLYPHQQGVIVSGYASPERAQLVTELGLVWLAKPYTADSLARAVHAALVTDETASERMHGGG